MMKILTIIIFLTLLFVLSLPSFSQSQPPPPRPPEISKYQLSKAEHKYTDSKTNNNTPDKPPVVLKVIKTPPAESKKNNIPKYSDDKSLHAWTLNVLLVIFNGVLAISTIALWWSTRKLSALTYKAFIATNRPRLRIRRVHSDPDILPSWVYISNVGGSKATGIELYAISALRTGSVREAPWTENLSKSIWHGPNILAPGEEAVYELRSKPDVVISIFKIALNRQILSIIGKVRYRDANETERETGFGWTYDPGTGEFAKPEKEDQYNYED